MSLAYLEGDDDVTMRSLTFVGDDQSAMSNYQEGDFSPVSGLIDATFVGAACNVRFTRIGRIVQVLITAFNCNIGGASVSAFSIADALPEWARPNNERSCVGVSVLYQGTRSIGSVLVNPGGRLDFLRETGTQWGSGELVVLTSCNFTYAI